MSLKVCFVLCLVSQCVFAQSLIPPNFHNPFWKTKKEVAQKMQNDGLLVVSASTGEIAEGLYEMKVVAGGVAETPYNFTKKTVQDYELLPQADSSFREVRFDSKNNKLYLHMAALGYHAKMHLKLQTQELDKSFQIQWECVQGSFKGMKGVFELIELERHKTEISMTAEYRASKLPLPSVLMGAGLEAVGKITAYKLRDFVHKRFRN